MKISGKYLFAGNQSAPERADMMEPDVLKTDIEPLGDRHTEIALPRKRMFLP